MILRVGVDLPEIVKFGVGQNIFDAQHRRHHGVVLIVVFVHPIATDKVQIRITRVEFLPNRRNVTRIVVIVNRIRFFLANHSSIDNVAFLRETDLDQLAFRQLDQIFVFGFPKTVAFEAKVFQAVTSFVRIRNHFGRPGFEILDATDFDSWIVDVDPVVRKLIPLFQNFGRAPSAVRNFRTNSANQFAHRRRGNYVFRFDRLEISVAVFELNGPCRSCFVVSAAVHARAHFDFAAHRFHFIRARFPHHARAFARIPERIDQGFDDLGAVAIRGTLRQERVLDRAAQ